MNVFPCKTLEAERGKRIIESRVQFLIPLLKGSQGETNESAMNCESWDMSR